jgi:GGDEF domain-containing protein
VAWSIAVYTAWLAAFTVTGLPTLWLFVLYAGLIGKWAEARPPRHPSEMVSRALALIAGAYILHIHAGTELGGPGGTFFFWLSITCLYYAFMLRPAWGAIVVAFALIEFVVASLHVPGALGGPEMLAQVGFLCVFPLLLAMKFGAAMRQPDDAMETGRIDSSTTLFNSSGFAAHGNEMLAASRRDKRPLSVAVFNCSDLLEVREIYGSRIARELMNRIVEKLSSVSAGRGLAARTGPAEFSVVLPGMGRDKAIAAIHRALGNPMRIEMDAGDSEIVLVPEFQVQAAGPDVASVEALQQALHDELIRIDAAQQRRQHHMQRERERHSRPMPAVALPAAQSARKAPVAQCPTMPLPLAALGSARAAAA